MRKTRFQDLLDQYPRQFWLLLAGMLMSTLGASMIWPFLTIYVSESLELPLATVAGLISLNAVMGLVFSFIAGPVTDRFGRKWVMVFSLFWIQLAFNIAWSIVFFGAKSPGGGLFIIVCLWLLILAVIVTAFRVATAASLLLLPYLLWVSLATYLNWGIWVMNKDQSKGIDIIGT